MTKTRKHNDTSILFHKLIDIVSHRMDVRTVYIYHMVNIYIAQFKSANAQQKEKTLKVAIEFVNQPRNQTKLTYG